MSDEFRYPVLEEDALNKLWKKHKNIIESFIGYNKFEPKHIYINESKVLAIIAKVDQRKKYYEYFHGLEMSEFKEVGLICFWYIKLKPICISSKERSVKDDGELDAINEKLALYFIISTFRNILRRNNISTKVIDGLPKAYLREILYSFEYRDISKETMVLLIESIAVFLGLNPYQESEELETDSKK